MKFEADRSQSVEPYSRRFHVRWGDMDFNAHMRNTAYLDVAADVRLMYFEQRGFSMREFERMRIGPVVLREEIEYYREFRLLEQMTVNLLVAGLSDDAGRMRLRNEFFRDDGRLVARVWSFGGWLDLDARRLTAPPVPVAEALRSLARCADFEPLAADADERGAPAPSTVDAG